MVSTAQGRSVTDPNFRAAASAASRVPSRPCPTRCRGVGLRPGRLRTQIREQHRAVTQAQPALSGSARAHWWSPLHAHHFSGPALQALGQAAGLRLKEHCWI